MLSATNTNLGRRVRVTVIYQHPMLRDLAVHVLTTAGADVAGVLRSEDLCMDALLALRPDVLVVDRAAADDLGWLSQAMVFGPNQRCATRVVTIGVSERMMVTCQKRVVTDPTVNGLVEAVCDPLPQCL